MNKFLQQFAKICSSRFPSKSSVSEGQDAIVITGLGNPGQEYQGTRHNIGHFVLDAFAESLGGTWSLKKNLLAEECRVDLGGQKIFLIKPTTYMNQSGLCLSKVLRFYKINVEKLIVVYDDITLDVGGLKLATTGGNGGHNGIKDILKYAGGGFVRFRVGIGGKKHPEMDLADHVLGKITENERVIFMEKVNEFIVGLKLVVDKGANLAMNSLNRKKKNNDTDKR